MRSLKEDLHAVIDLGVVLMIGIAFAALMMVAYVVWTLKGQLWSGTFSNLGSEAKNSYWNITNNQMNNITAGFDNATSLILVAVTIFILAIAISALLMLRGREG